MKALIRAIAFCREMGNSAAMSSFAKREVMPGNLAGRALESFVRDAATACLHQNCTAKRAAADRHSAQQMAQRIGVSRPRVWRWQQRFAESGIERLLRDKTRKPGKAPIAAEKIEQRDAPLSDLNEPPQPNHHQFAELDAHNFMACPRVPVFRVLCRVRDWGPTPEGLVVNGSAAFE
jgi:hypothetical protein